MGRRGQGAVPRVGGLGPSALVAARSAPQDGAMTAATEFEDALSGLRATGASVAATEVVHALDRHGREEAELLTRYERYVEQTGSPVARYLVRLIVDEERRHHRMLEELANTIAWGHFGDDDRIELPSPPVRRSGSDRALRAETRALLRHERQDRRQLRRLGRRLRTYGDVPLWNLLIELMKYDTEKHVSILRFIEKDDRGRPRNGFWTRTTARARRLWAA
jgi:hypothetical protein